MRKKSDHLGKICLGVLCAVLMSGCAATPKPEAQVPLQLAKLEQGGYTPITRLMFASATGEGMGQIAIIRPATASSLDALQTAAGTQEPISQ